MLTTKTKHEKPCLIRRETFQSKPKNDRPDAPKQQSEKKKQRKTIRLICQTELKNTIRKIKKQTHFSIKSLNLSNDENSNLTKISPFLPYSIYNNNRLI